MHYMYMYVPVADPGMLPGLIWLVIMAHQLMLHAYLGYFSVHISSVFVNIIVYVCKLVVPLLNDRI